MAKRTIQSCWKQYEKLADGYFATGKAKQAAVRSLRQLTKKANEDDVGASLVTIFVRPHLPLDLKVQFVFGGADAKFEWQTTYDSKSSSIRVDPMAVIKFIRDGQKIQITEKDREDFLHARYLSLLREVVKLPPIYILFMLVLQRVAFLLEIAHLEKRGGVVEVAEGEAYHTLLWAFKEFEIFSRKTWGLSLRAKYGISWYESEWITGR